MCRIKLIVACLAVTWIFACPALCQLPYAVVYFQGASKIDIDLDAAGNVYVTYAKPDADRDGIYVNRIDPAMQLLGPEVAANTVTSLDQFSPAIGVNANGHHVVAWQTDGVDGFVEPSFRRFGADGAPTGDEVPIPGPLNDVYSLFVAPDESFRIYYPMSGPHELYLFSVHVDPADNMLGPAPDPSLAPPYFGYHVSSCTTADFIVESYIIWPSEYGVRGQLRSGETIDFAVPEIYAIESENWDVPLKSDITENGQSVVVWSGVPLSINSRTGAIRAQRFDVNGQPIGGTLIIYNGEYSQFDVALFSCGDYVVAWESDDAIHMRQYFSQYDLLGPEYGTAQLPTGVTYKFRLQADDARSRVLCAYNTADRCCVMEIPVVLVQTPVYFAGANATIVREGVQLDWVLSFDENVQGLRIYRKCGGVAVDVSGRMLPNDARRFVDKSVLPGTEYEYTVSAVRPDKSEVLSRPVRVSTPVVSMTLSHGVPNPFRHSVDISFSVENRARTSLAIYDTRGAHVITLRDEVLNEGSYSATWNSCDETGRPVPAGVYFSVLKSDSKMLSRKMVIVR